MLGLGVNVRTWHNYARFPLGDFVRATQSEKQIRHCDWLKLAGEKIRHVQAGTVPYFLSVRVNKVAKWKTDFRLPRLGIIKYAIPVWIMHVISNCAELSCDPVSTC